LGGQLSDINWIDIHGRTIITRVSIQEAKTIQQAQHIFEKTSEENQDYEELESWLKHGTFR
jgi:hypothetical protein